jgi:hypothetical protein
MPATRPAWVLAGLVAAAGQARAVVALDPQVDAQFGAQPGRRLQRRRQMGETGAGEAGKIHQATLCLEIRGMHTMSKLTQGRSPE